MTMTLVETLAEALGHKRTPNSRCLARVPETPPQLRPPGPHNPPMWCCVPQGHDGQHRHNGGGMHPSIPFRDTDKVVMGDPLPDYCEKCRYIWPCPDVQAITAALSAQPAQSVDVLPFDDDVQAILGRMCFQCIRLAAALRAMGHTIDERAEAEQAAVLHWLLNHYLKHGKGWSDAASAELEAGRAAALQEKSNG